MQSPRPAPATATAPGRASSLGRAPRSTHPLLGLRHFASLLFFKFCHTFPNSPWPFGSDKGLLPQTVLFKLSPFQKGADIIAARSVLEQLHRRPRGF